jgi:thiol-disulfide isomerase/thioredoxin
MRVYILGIAVTGFALITGISAYHYRTHGIVPGTEADHGYALENQVVSEEAHIEIIGTQRPGFSMEDVHGQLRHIDEWDGQVIAINFWATWCAPCLKEIPEFIHLQEKYANQGLQFIGIALQKPEEVLGFIEEKAMNYPVMAGEMVVVNLARQYGNELGALPYTVIIDKEGIVAFVKLGQLSVVEAEKVITRLL